MTIKLSKEDWVEKYVQPNVLDDLKELSQVHNFDPEEELKWLVDQEYQCYIDNFPKD
ncbi:MAG: hypothetical protein WC679_02025 [Bacteroidales bacterium]|jgi:hypothetical protein